MLQAEGWARATGQSYRDTTARQVVECVKQVEECVNQGKPERHNDMARAGQADI